MGKSKHPKLLKKAESASAKNASAIDKNLTRYSALAKTLSAASTMADKMPRDYNSAKTLMQDTMVAYVTKVYEIIDLEEKIAEAAEDKKAVKDLEKKVKAADKEADALRTQYGTHCFTFKMLDDMVYDEIVKAMNAAQAIDREWPTKDKL